MKAQTVNGIISGDELGVTLTHEHILWNSTAHQTVPTDERERTIASGPLRPDILGALRFNPGLLAENMIHADQDLALEELKEFTAAGGKTIVEVTTDGRADPGVMRSLANKSGLNIIMGTGYSTQPALDEKFSLLSIQEITAHIVTEITSGMDGTDIKAGIIGEIGTSGIITPDEEKSLRGAARAQSETGAPLMIHLDGWARQGGKVLDIIAGEHGDLEQTILSHMNPSWFDLDYQFSLADRGAWLGYDMFGIDHFYPPDRPSPGEMPALEAVAKLIETGYVDRILLSHDVYLKMMLCRYGGYGYAHLFTNVKPYFALCGITDSQLKKMFIENPKNVLAVF